MRREQGFTLVELLIAMTMFIIVIASVASVFAPLLTQFKQQSKSAETQIEGIIGLEMLRRDIKHAGFGLPWNMDGATYTEAENDGGSPTPWVDRDLSDGPPNNPARGTTDAALASNPPGAIRSDRGGSATLGGTTLYDSDVLVLKSANAAINGASQRWTLLGAGDVKRNGLSGEDFENSDRVFVISPGNSDTSRRRLVRSDEADPTSWRTAYNATSIADAPPDGFEPTGSDVNIIYGIKSAPSGGGAVSATDPRMPFNRTEYYVRIPNPVTTPMPNQCAVGTGILYKSDLNHSNGLHNELPVLDCVADFQVVYTTNTGALAAEFFTNTLTAREIREQIRAVSVYILVQEGQQDPTNCTVANPCVSLVAPNTVRVGPTGLGRDFDMSVITDWQNYRWKVYTITATLENIR